MARDGAILWTDPSGALMVPGMAGEDVQRYLEYHGVLRLAADHSVTLLADDFAYPNGLCFSPDESILYIDDTWRQHIRAFDIQPNGSLTNDRVFFELVGDERGVADGLKVDIEGNVYVTGPAGIQVTDNRGKLLGRIHIPGQVTNMAWGGDDWRYLYVTTFTSLFKLRLGVPGLPVGTAAGGGRA